MILAFIDETLPLQFAPGVNLSLTWIYRETLSPPCDVIDDVITIKKNFFGIIWDDLIIWEVRLKLCLIFQIFQNGHFELATNFFYRKFYTGSWIYQNDSHEDFWHFEYLIDANFKIWPILLPGDVINDVMNIYLYNCSHKLMIPMHRKFNDDICARFKVIMKNVVISFIKEYNGPTLRPPATLWHHRWPVLLPGDYNCSHKLMIPMHRKFNDDICARF